jgi:cobalamin biosynthesis protein CbiD
MINKKLQKAFGIGALVLALGAGAVSCESNVAQRKIEPLRIELKTSQSVDEPVAIQYNGMNTEKNFSISDSWRRDQVNIYYSIDSKEINFKNSKLKVIEVTPEHIILDYLGKSTDR